MRKQLNARDVTELVQVVRPIVGITQDDLAEKAGVSRQMISNWERGFYAGVTERHDTTMRAIAKEILADLIDQL